MVAGDYKRVLPILTAILEKISVRLLIRASDIAGQSQTRRDGFDYRLKWSLMAEFKVKIRSVLNAEAGSATFLKFRVKLRASAAAHRFAKNEVETSYLFMFCALTFQSIPHLAANRSRAPRSAASLGRRCLGAVLHTAATAVRPEWDVTQGYPFQTSKIINHLLKPRSRNKTGTGAVLGPSVLEFGSTLGLSLLGFKFLVWVADSLAMSCKLQQRGALWHQKKRMTMGQYIHLRSYPAFHSPANCCSIQLCERVSCNKSSRGCNAPSAMMRSMTATSALEFSLVVIRSARVACKVFFCRECLWLCERRAQYVINPARSPPPLKASRKTTRFLSLWESLPRIFVPRNPQHRRSLLPQPVLYPQSVVCTRHSHHQRHRRLLHLLRFWLHGNCGRQPTQRRVHLRPSE